ncbi:MAG TPA: hypothetical protein ENK12_08075 [Gammaproteobacteria bacterium]|nr:hypothetical protein [Gammaproteobacteria bacterium]
MVDERESEGGQGRQQDAGAGDVSQAGEAEERDAEVVAREAERLMFRDMAQYMSQFARSFEVSAKRWELVVYPSLLAFIILAAYGFYLIYNLTSDIGRITYQVQDIAESMVNINQNFSSTTNNMNTVARNLVKMTGYMEQMSHDIKEQNAAMGAIVISMKRMNESIDTMSFTMYQMRYDTAIMGRNIHSASGPMRFMNSFMPW